MNDKIVKADLMVVQLDRARTALAEAKTIGETKKIMDMAHAAQIYARRQQLGDEAIEYAHAIKIEAMRKLGEILHGNGIHRGGSKFREGTLNEIGIDAKTSMFAQQLAAMPAEQFERVKAGEMTVKEARKEGKKEERGKAKEKIEASADFKLDKRCKLGDVWILGDHVLYCGDTSTTQFRSIIKKYANGTAALAFADPPYGANITGYDDAKFYWEHDYLAKSAEVVVVTPGIVSIFELARRTSMPYQWSLAAWITNGMTRGAVGFGNWIYAAVFASGSVFRQAQDFYKVTISISETADTKHPTRKPTEYVQWIVDTFSKPNQTVIDPFLGSGQTLLVCETSERNCIGGELDPMFCAAIIARWETLTSKTAEKA